MGARKATRGQSLVEASLGLMVFVTILLFGIYFAEVGALTLKVQEAANFALWDATAHVQHNPAAGDWQRDNAQALAESEANARYRDFDGRRSEGGGARTIQQAIARASSIQVRCDTDLPGGLTGITPDDAGPAVNAAMRTGSRGMACTASSRMRGMRIGRFMEPDFFRVSQRRAAAAFTVCAAGRASGGACNGRFALLLDDWGLSGVEEGRACALNIDGAANCNNPDYYEWTQRVYRANGGGGGAGSALAALAGASAGINEDQFFMSYRGEEDNYEQNIGATHAGGQSIWEVSPFRVPQGQSYAVPRQNSWLGGVPR